MMSRERSKSSVWLRAVVIAFGVGCAGLATAQIRIPPVPTSVIHVDNPTVVSGARPDVVSGNEDVVVHVNVPKGKHHRLLLFFDVDAECLNTSPSAEIVNAPTNGAITITSVTTGNLESFRWPSDDPRRNCNPSNIAALALDYSPNPSFVGRDSGQVNVTDHHHRHRFGFLIDVK